MSTELQDLLERARDGDRAAGGELVLRYEQSIRRAIRVRLVNKKLQRRLDSSDIYQSVLRRALSAFAEQKVQAEEPEQFENWLKRVARNRLAEAGRKQRRQDQWEEEASREAWSEEDLLERLIQEEVLALVRSQLSPEACRIADLRGQDEPWAAIAARFGEKEDAIRKRFTREVQRVLEELGLNWL